MKTTKSAKSFLETAYEITKKQCKPIFIYDLLKQTCKKHQITHFNDFNQINQLYLDIVLSGQFVFCDDQHLMIKENNREFWDKDFFEKPHTDQTDDLADDLDFKDFLLEETENQDIKDKNIDSELEDDLLDSEKNPQENKKRTLMKL